MSVMMKLGSLGTGQQGHFKRFHPKQRHAKQGRAKRGRLLRARWRRTSRKFLLLPVALSSVASRAVAQERPRVLVPPINAINCIPQLETPNEAVRERWLDDMIGFGASSYIMQRLADSGAVDVMDDRSGFGEGTLTKMLASTPDSVQYVIVTEMSGMISDIRVNALGGGFEPKTVGMQVTSKLLDKGAVVKKVTGSGKKSYSYDVGENRVRKRQYDPVAIFDATNAAVTNAADNLLGQREFFSVRPAIAPLAIAPRGVAAPNPQITVGVRSELLVDPDVEQRYAVAQYGLTQGVQDIFKQAVAQSQSSGVRIEETNIKVLSAIENYWRMIQTGQSSRALSDTSAEARRNDLNFMIYAEVCGFGGQVVKPERGSDKCYLLMRASVQARAVNLHAPTPRLLLHIGSAEIKRPLGNVTKEQRENMQRGTEVTQMGFEDVHTLLEKATAEAWKGLLPKLRQDAMLFPRPQPSTQPTSRMAGPTRTVSGY